MEGPPDLGPRVQHGFLVVALALVAAWIFSTLYSPLSFPIRLVDWLIRPVDSSDSRQRRTKSLATPQYVAIAEVDAERIPLGI
jgi:hypothetical protein